MNRAVIGVGSNIRPDENVARALEMIASSCSILARSRFVETTPVGRPDQPNYLNGAVLIETALDREALKARLLRIEGELGRVRTEDRYATRTIDLDIVVWNDVVIDPEVYERDYLRRAVAAVCPTLGLDPPPATPPRSQ